MLNSQVLKLQHLWVSPGGLKYISLEFKMQSLSLSHHLFQMVPVSIQLYGGVFVLWTWELMNQFLKYHQLNRAEIGVTDESISDWISN